MPESVLSEKSKLMANSFKWYLGSDFTPILKFE